jgi:hypothetical protein
MAIISLKPGTTSVTLGSRARFAALPPQLQEIPGGLYPMKMSVYELDEYRVLNGWPMSVPDCDIRADVLVSAEGEVLENRLDPGQITTNAIVRWIAAADYYDTTDLRWRAIQRGADVEWETSVTYAPTLIHDYQYRIGAERFLMDALNFDSDTRNHMWMDLSRVLPVTGYTVILVMSPNSTYGNNQTVPYNGIWCFGGPPPGTDTFTETSDTYMNVTLQGNFLYFESEQEARAKTLGISPFLNGNAPLYLAMTFKHPQALLYGASGPSNIKRYPVPTGDLETSPDPHVVLGRSTGDVLHTADMALFEVGIYPGPLTDAEVRAEFALLAQVYGGDT